MDRIVMTSPFSGLCHMQVCAEKDVSDEEVLSFCNRVNASGTTLGWCAVERTGNLEPVPCANDPERLHILVSC